MKLLTAALIALVVLAAALVIGLLRRLRRQGLELERSRQADLMYRAALRLSGSLESEEIYLALRELVVRAIPCDGMVVSSFDAASGTVRCAFLWVNGQLLDPGALPVLPIDLVNGRGMQTEVIRSGEGRLYADVQDRVRRGGRYFDVSPDGKVRDLSPPGARPPAARCALMVPIKLEGKVVGIVQAMSDTPGAYAQEHLSILQGLVAPMAVALQNAELYARAHREIAERTRVERALVESEERLREADKRKDEFLATLAHELRNPLAPIRNALHIMRLTGNDGPALERARTMMERQLGQMVRLIDDLLDVSRITRGKLALRKERVELAAVVHNAVETARPLIEASGHDLTVTLPAEPITLDADPMRLAQVFANLLNNAAKYMERGGRIWLTVGLRETEASISVRDTGTGIPAEALPSIFEMFTQVDRSLEKSQGGLGIGLTLVKRLVEMHGGSVEAKSEGPGKGAEFIALLPVVSESPSPQPSKREEGRPSNAVTCRILIADDNKDSAESMGTLLRLMGNEVRMVHDGVQAVEEAATFRPDVILLDIGMPRLDGYAAARRIREERWGRAMVLVALTGWGQEEDKRRATEAGFDKHFTKPVDPTDLEQLVAGLHAHAGPRDGRFTQR